MLAIRLGKTASPSDVVSSANSLPIPASPHDAILGGSTPPSLPQTITNAAITDNGTVSS